MPALGLERGATCEIAADLVGETWTNVEHIILPQGWSATIRADKRELAIFLPEDNKHVHVMVITSELGDKQ